ncbi:hypothetical protein BpHYR1_038359 [Brachionus plicatilis]|uniref:Uncharacterized protein n=1 Tax=Brachionus plicatilis TaxID=10195 RepID=A0A3M7R2W9_BRAPC|nr:hypothetical protein BpHYR1_038359 [Brachionus plicatilis]
MIAIIYSTDNNINQELFSTEELDFPHLDIVLEMPQTIFSKFNFLQNDVFVKPSDNSVQLYLVKNTTQTLEILQIFLLSVLDYPEKNLYSCCFSL